MEEMSTKQKGRGMVMGADGRHKTFSVEVITKACNSANVIYLCCIDIGSLLLPRQLRFLSALPSDA